MRHEIDNDQLEAAARRPNLAPCFIEKTTLHGLVFSVEKGAILCTNNLYGSFFAGYRQPDQPHTLRMPSKPPISHRWTIRGLYVRGQQLKYAQPDLRITHRSARQLYRHYQNPSTPRSVTRD
jgi:recombinational DNA repair protein (RecF pathway)